MPYRSTIIVPLFLILLMLLLVTAACSLPEFSTESSSAANAVPADNQEGTEQTVASGNDASTASENADKQAGVAAAADAVAEEVVAEVAPAEVVESTESEAAPVDINWLATTNQVEYELRAIGNPDAALTITEFSDFM